MPMQYVLKIINTEALSTSSILKKLLSLDWCLLHLFTNLCLRAYIGGFMRHLINWAKCQLP